MVTTDYIGKSALNNSFGALQKKKTQQISKGDDHRFFSFLGEPSLYKAVQQLARNYTFSNNSA